ncbi:MAG TPA: histidine kinase [Clostridiales bacterium]|nr:histidine kinase [Clostridiales bacterium]
MFKKKSYLKKSLMIYASFITVIIMAFIVVYCMSQAMNIKKDTDSTMRQLTSKAASQFESILDEMSNISLGIASNQYVYDAMEDTLSLNSTKNYFQDHLEEKKVIQKEIIALCGTHFANKSFNVISEQYDWLELNIYESDRLTKQDIQNISWVRHVFENKLSKYISPVGKDEYGRTEEGTFSFVRAIQNEFHHYGLIDIQYEKKFLDEIFIMQLQGNDMSAIVTDDAGLFYATDNAPLHSLNQLEGLAFGKADSQTINDVLLSDGKYTVCTQKINNYNMTVYIMISTKEYLRPIYDASGSVLLFGFFILLLLLVVVYIISYNLYKPIRQLRNTIDHMDYLSLSLDLQVDSSNNEILLLTNAFDKMFEGIKRTRNELVESRTRELKANYQVLQEQINPHFMHNILSVIGLMGYQKDAPEIMDICSQLTRMLQYSTGTGSAVVKVCEEFEHVETYLRLMKYRYLDMLQYTVRMDKGLKNVEIPKFILQPLAENCFQHSFANHVKTKYIISIEGRITAKGWEISVADNGSGFTRESVEKLKGQFREIEKRIQNGEAMPDTEIGGLALINTYARLYLYSHGQIQIKIEESSMGGSCVSIYMKEGFDGKLDGC